MVLQEMGDLRDAALEFAECRGYGPRSVDGNGWTLFHHAAAQSQHQRGMLEVIRGLLEVMPIEFIDQKTNGGTPQGWAALSLVCNARDGANERAGIAQFLVDQRADVDVRNPHGATPLMAACACGNWSAVQVLLDAGADVHTTNDRGRDALDVTPREQTKVG